MKLVKLGIIMLLLSVNYAVFSQEKMQQKLSIIKFADLEKMINKPEGIFVINFWASWCKPCVAELPTFDSLANNFRQNKVNVIFISLDFKQNSAAVSKFIVEKNIHSKVYLLDEPDYDSWINKVSPQWSGSIPATIISNGTKKEFYEQAFDYQMLNKMIKAFL